MRVILVKVRDRNRIYETMGFKMTQVWLHGGCVKYMW